ncbi:restriction endonuclease subunit S [Achromobacter ruhlandii]|uniref:restriction endonuclease subunit S n=1 Tax=Achromobacter ruhlandii TaxID=72557 RepID=UPI003BA2A61B
MQSDAGWKELNLGDVIELKRGYDLPKGKRSVGVIPIVSSSGISDFHSEAMVKGPGVVTGRYGTIGEVFYIDGDFWPLNTTLYVCDFKGSDPRFISYFLRTLDFQAYSDKGAVPGVNRNHLHTAKIRIPALPVQKAIARVLDALDSKIDLNCRINETLEAMAQAIFKSWFVHFDPVKAKIAAIEQGEDPLRAAMRAISGKTDAELDQMPRGYHDQLAATAALFPDAMEESELGEIPKKWVPTAVRDVAEVVKGKSYSSKDLIDNDDVALVTLKSFERGGGFRMDGFKPYIGPYKPEQVVLPGDLIVAYTDVTQAAELIGKPAIVVGFEKYKTLVASLDVGIIRPANERVSRQFLYGLFKTDSFQSHTFAHTSGTTVLHLAKEGVPSYIFACPAPDLVGIYSEVAEKMSIKKQGILDQSRSLLNLRDTILPKLLSGELAIDEVVGLADTTGVT